MRTYPGLLTNAVRSALRSKHDLMLENLALRRLLRLACRLLCTRGPPMTSGTAWRA